MQCNDMTTYIIVYAYTVGPYIYILYVRRDFTFESTGGYPWRRGASQQIQPRRGSEINFWKEFPMKFRPRMTKSRRNRGAKGGSS